MTDAPHIPVMAREVVAALAPHDDGIYVDGTFGAGGYSKAILAAARCRVFGIDRDPDAVARGRELAKSYDGRLTVLHGRFSEMDALISEKADGVALDLGVSSMQLDQVARGFTFREDGPLDMRMEQSGPSAADAVNTLDEGELASIIRDLGEERHARRVARAIVAKRSQAPITRTGTLASVVRSVVRQSKDGIDPATRTFQALRIYVNDELGELDRGLEAAERILGEGGRLAVVAFHSLEDRRVKAFLKKRAGETGRPSRHMPDQWADEAKPTYKLLKRGTIKPTDEETAANPRARSARLRIAERTGVAAWQGDQS